MKKLKYYIPLALCILVVGMYALMKYEPLEKVTAYLNTNIIHNQESVAWQEGYLYVDVIDVGQGDSIFIKTPNGSTMLIDAGDSDAYDAIEKVLKANNVKKLDVLVATHPHADHIGSMEKIYEEYGAKKIYMPKAVTTTATYKNLLTAISNNNQKITTAKAGVSIDLDSSIHMQILSPQDKTYDDLNDYSVVIKCTYKNNSVLFTGDATENVEEEILTNYPNALKSNVLKVAHHGSRGSSSSEFLGKVDPTYAIISCGIDNSYGHPHSETLERLNSINAIIKRTDEAGSIEFVMDGDNIIFGNN